MKNKPLKYIYSIAMFLLMIAYIFISSCSGTRTMVTEKTEEYMDITVMSYNIHAGSGGDKTRLTTAEGMGRMAILINKYNPDILLIQEIDRGARRSQLTDEVAWIKENLGYEYGEMAPAIVDGDWNFGVATFTRHDFMVKSIKVPLFKPDYSKTHPEYPGYYAEQRVLFHVIQDMSADGSGPYCSHLENKAPASQRINFYNTHLGLTADQRMKQLAEIDAYIESNSGGLPVILGGDFNTGPDTDEMKPLNDNLKNVFDGLGLPDEERYTFPVGTSPVKEIDGIYVSTDIKVMEAFVVRDASLASDHNPVVAKLRIPVKR